MSVRARPHAITATNLYCQSTGTRRFWPLDLVLGVRSGVSLVREGSVGTQCEPEERNETVLAPVPARRRASSTSAPVVVAEQSAEAFAPEHAAVAGHRFPGRLDDVVPATLVRPFAVVVLD